jgi:superoxide dismutase, Cu-Zn family
MRRATRTILLFTSAAVIGGGACSGPDKPSDDPLPFANVPPLEFPPDAFAPQGPPASANGKLMIDPGAPQPTLVAQAVATLKGTKGSDATGSVRFAATPEGLRVKVALTGLTFLGKYVLRVHVLGDCSGPDGLSAGPDFNFEGSSFNPPTARGGLGSLGELEADVNGKGEGEAKVARAAIQGPYSIIGRSVVVHGRGSDGKDGASLACGTIGIYADPQAQ